MLLNILVFLMIVMITLYMTTQGVVSALVALATSIFASILAMALMEPLQGIIAGWRPEYARGVTFLALFLLAYGITRFAADAVIKKNIALPQWAKRGVGGLLGFFTGLVVMGSIVIGIEMLPVQRKVFGFDRFPGETIMQAVDADGKPVFGEVSKRTSNLWFSPERFVLAIWNGASGRALGGNRPWASVHPDIATESYGYRTPVYNASSRVAASDLVKVLGSWSSADPKEYVPRGIPPQIGKNGENRRVVLVSVEIKKGDTAPHVTSDMDPYFRISAVQVRLVTDKSHQYYPVGSMFQGRTFEPLFLDSGFIVDEYVGKSANTIVQDWVFAINDDEKPTLFELKQSARTDQLAVGDKPFAPRPLEEYAARPYYKDLCTLTVNFDAQGAKIIAGHVYVLKPDGVLKDVFSLLKPAYESVNTTVGYISDSTNGWTNPVKPGLPPKSQFETSRRIGVDLVTNPDTTNVNWPQTLPILLLGEAAPDARQFLAKASTFMTKEMIPSWNAVRSGSLIAGQGDIDPTTMKAVISRITPNRHPVVITLETENSFYVWALDTEFAGTGADKSKKAFAFNAVASLTPTGENGPVFRIDLNEKPPQ